MCLSQVGVVLAVDAERVEALVEVGERRTVVSLVVLVFDGEAIAPGDRLLVDAGFALEHVHDDGFGSFDSGIPEVTT